MANEEHLRLLKKGVTAWNKWRLGSPLTRPDLIAADLTRADLFRADLSTADLSAADLRWANLNEANLIAAALINANLSEADLSKADLIRANLTRATLSGADLRATNFMKADVCEADFSEATLGFSVFVDVDLSKVKGFETIIHYAPSSIGIDTIYRSQGKIPAQFLRGAGVPENFIEYMHSLTGAAFNYYSCFISYSSKDQEFADRLYADFQAKGVRCWLATEDLKIGDKFRQRIDDAIRFHDKLLVVLSQASVNSSWVEEEVEAAFARECKENKLVLFPVRLDDAVMTTDKAWAATLQRMRHIGDFTKWQEHNSYQKGFQRLLRDLKGERSQESEVRSQNA